MAIKKYLLVYEAYSGDHVFLFKGNAAVQVDTDKEITTIGSFFTQSSFTEARMVDNSVTRVAVIGVVEL